jgi:hypothetical protein
MKKIFLLSLIACLSACQSMVPTGSDKYTSAWISQNIVKGKTTRSDIESIYGPCPNPIVDSSGGGSCNYRYSSTLNKTTNFLDSVMQNFGQVPGYDYLNKANNVDHMTKPGGDPRLIVYYRNNIVTNWTLM